MSKRAVQVTSSKEDRSTFEISLRANVPRCESSSAMYLWTAAMPSPKSAKVSACRASRSRMSKWLPRFDDSSPGLEQIYGYVYSDCITAWFWKPINFNVYILIT